MKQAHLLLRHPWGWLATGFGSGLAPWAPGTFGSLAALLPWLLLRELPLTAVFAVVIVVFVLGVLASEWAMQKLGGDDPGCVVIDEWVGLWIALFVAPPGWWWLLAGFVLFRLFDIAKPWPVGWLERRLEGGLGVMADDVAAGFMAALVLVLAGLWV
ncbi:MAG TPA: phosphatidylglycerophosphatase A [Xanthomonadaceae bacterium]|nr:phosphatidylglycerophosphatase A [Xanthomonadaceae bacterium]